MSQTRKQRREAAAKARRTTPAEVPVWAPISAAPNYPDRLALALHQVEALEHANDKLDVQAQHSALEVEELSAALNEHQGTYYIGGLLSGLVVGIGAVLALIQ
jgi:hypothetical protein